jgi:hypothetical protein
MDMIASAGCGDRRLETELKVAAPIGRGKSAGARRVQELLVANGIKLVVDGDFGDATQTGLDRFCVGQGIAQATTVDQALMDRLAQPLLRAVVPVAPQATLGDTVVAIARQHLKEHPIEIGKPNSGPWVRLYMKGSEGPDFPWCAGFVTYIVGAAAAAHGKATPITYTFSCDSLGMEAKHSGKFVRRVPSSTAAAGSVFLVPHPSNANDWTHTGIITGGNGTVFDTIEGNTNDSGSREGFEVCDRIRACAKVDVVNL